MRDLGRLLALVVLLNLVRYLLGGPIESLTIMRPMHSVKPRYPEVFDNDFTTRDFIVALFYKFYNFMLWFVAELVFKPGELRSDALFFCSLAAAYLNHFTATAKPFFLWSMVDALILFPLVGLANGLPYPWFFRTSAD